MKNKYLIALACLFMVCFSSCRQQDYYSAMSEKIAQEMGDELEKYDNIVVFPGSGCTGCITEAENFFFTNIHNERIKFILTFITSRKGMTMRLGAENIAKENVLIDDKNTFYLVDYHDKIYPVIAFVENGKITKAQKL